MFYIERLQVEDGFLAGLDVSFSPDLNVLIGGRGTGKTSIIELLRFVLGAEGEGGDMSQGVSSHARSILGSGRVTIYVRSAGQSIAVTRGYDGKVVSTEQTHPALRPLIFAQSEIEHLALTPSGRRSVIDGFLPSPGEARRQISLLNSRITSLSLEAKALRKELEAAEPIDRSLAQHQKELETIGKEETKFAKLNQAISDKQATMRKVSEIYSELKVDEQTVATVSEFYSVIHDRIAALLVEMQAYKKDHGPRLEQSLPSPILLQAKSVDESLNSALAQIGSVTGLLSEQQGRLTKQRETVELQFQQLKLEIDNVQQGAGLMSRRAAEIRATIAKLQQQKSAMNSKAQRLKALLVKRAELLSGQETLAVKRATERQEIAKGLAASLRPRIGINLVPAGDLTDYTNELIGLLRGTAIRYNELAPLVTQKMPPRELVECVESGDELQIIDATHISAQRAARLVSELRDTDYERLLVSTVEDDIELSLQDGTVFKPIDQLSIGQRNTVMLPILLRTTGRPLVIDQPEDHLDNAFIVSTIVASILARKGKGQLIVSSHNANIPVLGEADRVIVLKSDGKRGFVEMFGSLDDNTLVEAITTLMEGGKEAFKRRAAFYASHGAPEHGQ